MRLVEFFNAVTLFEAAKDRYAQAFQGLIPVAQAIGKERELETEINTEISWALKVFRKDDKVTWYLRFIKVHVMGRLVSAVDAALTREPSPELEAIKKRLDRSYAKQTDMMAKKMGLTPEQIGDLSTLVQQREFKQRMQHFMSLGLRGIENYVFAWQNPEQIIADWTPVERAWQSQAGPLVDNDPEDGRVIKEYPDGSQWADLERPYCTMYGDAMGHCGNAGDPNEPNTSIVYRTLEETEKGPMWKPRLFFVLDKDTGLLGETKGRENQKPAEKYHSVILDLLRDPIVKGIKGGGYKPENNFKLEDLPEDVVEKLVEGKPGLATIRYDYNKRGMTKELLNRIKAIWTDTGEKWGEYKNKAFLFPTGQDVDDFVKEYGGDQAEWVVKNLNGDIDTDYWYDGMPYEDVWDELPSNIQQAVGKWVIENYPDEVEEWKEHNDQDFDGSDTRDTWAIIEEGDFEEVKGALRRAYETGSRYGAEAEMYEDLSSWVNDLPNERDLPVSLHPGIEKGWDSQQSYNIPEDTMIDIASDYLEDLEYEGDFGNFLGLKKLDAPYHGWQGYDSSAAVESAVEQLREEGVLP